MQRTVGLVVVLELELAAELVAGPVVGLAAEPGVVGIVDTHPVGVLEAEGYSPHIHRLSRHQADSW